MRKAAFIHSPKMEKFVYPPQCPFNVSRAGKTRKILHSMGLLSGKNTSEIPPTPAERIVLKKFHTAQYLHTLQRAAKGKFDPEALYMGIGTGDCPVFKDMFGYSIMACGATLTAVKLILDGSADAAFNPSGGLHHAGPDYASGFCYMNDVALGCMVLAEAGKKVLYLDVDVHHGDGVQNAFYDRNDVMTISFHQTGRSLFPGTGFEDEIGILNGAGYAVNVPLPIGTYDQAYINAFDAIALPLVTCYNPDVIVFDLGADALAGDPLAHLYLTNNTYADIIKKLLTFKKPILMTGGGGYDFDNTTRAWAYAWGILAAADSEKLAKLKDTKPAISESQRVAVEPVIEKTIETIRKNIFPIHGLK